MSILAAATTPGVAVAPEPVEEKRVEDELAYPILLSERVKKSAEEAVSFKFECSEVGKQSDRLSSMLRSAVRFATSSNQIYDRPLRRISAEVSRNLNKALILVRKCRRRSFFHRVVTIVGAADFRKIFSLLDASVGDMRWLLSILDGGAEDGAGGRGIVLSLPPIASNDPILSWVWSFVATVQLGQIPEKIEAANELASLAKDNDRNKKMIVEEGGIPPLLKLLKDGSSPEAQIAAATALYWVSNEGDRVRTIVKHHGVPLIVQVLTDSITGVQIGVSNLIGRMAEHDLVAKEEFNRENVIRPLVSFLSFETFDDEFDQKKFISHLSNHTFHSIVQINKDREFNGWKDTIGLKHRLTSSYSSFSSLHSDGGSSRGCQTRKERENENPELKRELKISCAKALWMLAKDSISNGRTITETKGLLCLAKLIEKEKDELQKNCLMAVMEIASAAEFNPDLRRSAFKTNSYASKAVVEQLMRIIKDSDDPSLQIPAVRSMGSLSRTFPARETRVICPLVDQLNNKNPEIATEAAIALGKFVSPENFNCQEHSKAIIDFNGVSPLLRLLRVSDRARLHGLILICYLAINGSNNEALEQARVLTALEGADRSVFAQQPEVKELIMKAMYHLSLYHPDVLPPRQLSLRR